MGYPPSEGFRSGVRSLRLLTSTRFLTKIGELSRTCLLCERIESLGEEPAMPSCPECENELDIELDEVSEGDIVACDECGTEYEIVGLEPLELARLDEDDDEDDDELIEEEDDE